MFDYRDEYFTEPLTKFDNLAPGSTDGGDH